MPEEEDWRIENAARFRGIAVRRASFRAPRPEWDHEHCIGCWQKFMQQAQPPEILAEGYVSLEGDHWVCPECLAEIGDSMGWTVVP